jgi:hypothetical protein
MKKYALILTLLITSHAFSKELSFGAFIDSYYAYDFNRPSDRERPFTTQPTRHNEFNINLAYLESVLERETLRGRLALQMGTSVTRNTIAERNRDLQYIQEVIVGKRLGENTWIDMGIFLSHIGLESWISKNNWVYSRALFSDNVPYYASGVRIQHENIQFIIMNGWGNMTENNEGKALGFQYKKKLSQKMSFTYNNFFGDEEVVSDRSRFRGYHNFVFEYLASSRWQYQGAIDFGHQSQQLNDGVDGWVTGAVIIRRILNPEQSLAMRAEYYADPHEANVVTNTSEGFQVTALSLNFDQKLEEKAMWRNEIRGFYSEDKIYPREAKSLGRLNGFIVTSLSLWY